MKKNTLCLWYESDAEEARAFLRQDHPRQHGRRGAPRTVRFPGR